MSENSYRVDSTRRTALKLLGAGALSGVTIGHVTADEQTLEHELRDARNATKRYRNLEYALEDGYQIMGPYVPNMGWHLVNLDAVDTEVSLTQPAGLTYNLQRQLGSVEYVLPKDDTKPDIFSDEGANNLKVSEEHGWHPHHGAQHVFSDHDGTAECDQNFGLDALLNPDNWIELSDELGLFPPEQPDLECGDTLYLDGDDDDTDPEQDRKWGVVDRLIEHGNWWTLHVWVHHDNPDGVFAPFNDSFDSL